MHDASLILETLLKNARAHGADAADAVLMSSSAISLSERQGKPEGLERAESRAVGLRVFLGQRSAIVSSSDTSPPACQELVSRALSMAALTPPDPYSGLAPKERLAQTIPDLDLYDPHEPSADWLQAQCASAEAAALSVPGITNSEGAEAAYHASRLTLATSHGFLHSQQSSMFSVSVSVLAGIGTAMERDYAFSSARFQADLSAPDALGFEAAEKALARLHPRKLASQFMPVIFDPRVGRGLLDAFLSAITGSAIARGTSFLKDAMGQPIFSPAIHIIDEPHQKRGLHSRPFDAEGLATTRQTLVNEGILATWLLDTRSANKLGLSPTGHATRGLAGPPSAGSSNAYIAPGPLTPGALMEDIKTGFYVTETFGMGVNLVTGDYSQGASGFLIENGVRAGAVSEVTIAGKLQEMFQMLTPANDLAFRYASNTPTLRIERMMVAGK